jgi:hypothetical protein
LGDTPPDTDNDGIADFRDTDSDDDGCPDSIEGTADVDNDGTPNYRDSGSLGKGCPARTTPTPTPTDTPTDGDDGNGDDGDGGNGDGGDDDDNGGGGGGTQTATPSTASPTGTTGTTEGTGGGGAGGAFGVSANVTATTTPSQTDEATGTPIGVEQIATPGGGQVLGAVRQLQPESDLGLLYPIRVFLSEILWPLLFSLIPIDIFYRAQRRYHQLDSVPGQPSISERRGNIPWLLYVPIATFFTTRVSLRLRQGILKLSNRLSRQGSDTDSMESLGGDGRARQPSDIELAFDDVTRNYLQDISVAY